LNSALSGAIDHRLVIYFGGVPRENRHDEEIESPERLMLKRVGVLFQQFASGAGKDKREFFMPGVLRRPLAGFERFVLADLHFCQGDFDHPARRGLNAKGGVQLAGESGAGDFMQRLPIPKGRDGLGHHSGWSSPGRQQGGAIKQEFSARGHNGKMTGMI
jgi:hypothetical protein